MTTDTLYSVTLLVALVSTSLGTVAAAMLAFRAMTHRSVSRSVQQALFACVLLGLGSGSLSMIVHFAYGHGPAAAEPMSAGPFIFAHPAYVAVATLSAACVLAWFFAGRGRR